MENAEVEVDVVREFHESMHRFRLGLADYGLTIDAQRLADAMSRRYGVKASRQTVESFFDPQSSTMPSHDKVAAACAVLGLPIGSLVPLARQGGALSDALVPLPAGGGPSAISSMTDPSVAGGVYDVFYYRPAREVSQGDMGLMAETDAAQVIRAKLTFGTGGSAELEELSERGSSSGGRRVFSGAAILACQGEMVVVNLHGVDEHSDFMSLAFQNLKLSGGKLLFIVAALTTSSGYDAPTVPVQLSAVLSRRLDPDVASLGDSDVESLVRPLLSMGTREIRVRVSEFPGLREEFPDLADCLSGLLKRGLAETRGDKQGRAAGPEFVYIDPMDVINAKGCPADSATRARAVLKLTSMDKSRRIGQAAHVDKAVSGLLRRTIQENARESVTRHVVVSEGDEGCQE